MKKIFSFLLVISMILAQTVPISLAETTENFNGIKIKYNEVDKENGIYRLDFSADGNFGGQFLSYLRYNSEKLGLCTPEGDDVTLSVEAVEMAKIGALDSSGARSDSYINDSNLGWAEMVNVEKDGTKDGFDRVSFLLNLYKGSSDGEQTSRLSYFQENGGCIYLYDDPKTDSDAWVIETSKSDDGVDLFSVFFKTKDSTTEVTRSMFGLFNDYEDGELRTDAPKGVAIHYRGQIVGSDIMWIGFPGTYPFEIQTPTEGATVGGNNVTITGVGTPGETVTITITDENGTVFVTGDDAKVTVDEGGNWTYTPTNTLPDGKYHADALQSDSSEDDVNFVVDKSSVTPAPTTTPKPTTRPGGGGVDPKPTITPKPSTTPTMTPGPSFEKESHYRYIMGYEDNTVRPNANISREEAVTIFFRLLTKDSRVKYRKAEVDFTDVEPTRWSIMSIGTMENAEKVNGYKDGTFRPSNFITRAEFAAITVRFDDVIPNSQHHFTDIDGHWAEELIATAVERGWIKGYDDNTFRPEQPITRAEAVTLINRVLERKVDEKGILEELIVSWSDLDKTHWAYYDIMEAAISHNYDRRDKNSIVENWTGAGKDLDFENE